MVSSLEINFPIDAFVILCPNNEKQFSSAQEFSEEFEICSMSQRCTESSVTSEFTMEVKVKSCYDFCREGFWIARILRREELDWIHISILCRISSNKKITHFLEGTVFRFVDTDVEVRQI